MLRRRRAARRCDERRPARGAPARRSLTRWRRSSSSRATRGPPALDAAAAPSSCAAPSRRAVERCGAPRSAPRPRALSGSVERAVCTSSTLDDDALASVARRRGASAAGRAPRRALWRAAAHAVAAAASRLWPQRIEPRAGWDDLVLPARAARGCCATSPCTCASAIASTDEWGFARQGAARPRHRGAVRAAPAAPARRWRPRCWRDELRARPVPHRPRRAWSASTSARPRRTCARVFDAAEACGAILLFDEADALFGKRSEVQATATTATRTSRSATCCSAWRPTAASSILTTNLKQAARPGVPAPHPLHRAVPVPGRRGAARHLARVFPAAMPRDGLDLDKLARLNVAGGHIRNIALNAAFLAADAGASRCAWRTCAARRESEYAKLERPLPRAEIGDWT